jgi:5-methylcytosine-specific restriction endonuclease McrA
MAGRDNRTTGEPVERIVAEVRRSRELRMKTYREQALKLFPHLCARCGRELTGKRLRELTVHHKDHDHENNPPDGSNWELLCVYCHDNEHARDLVADWYEGEAPADKSDRPAPLDSPFEKLAQLLEAKREDKR